jgi:mono/diheme cytochrome c family protein
VSRPTSVSPARASLLALACAASLAAAGCGGGLSVEEDSRSAATLFNQRCSGCHSLKSANSYGSKPAGQLEGGERTNGPNFNVRKVVRDDVLYAIRNGGFSGAIMPANIVTGEDAEALAEFLEEYSGRESSSQGGGGSGAGP